jgi:hypothetical protein
MVGDPKADTAALTDDMILYHCINRLPEGDFIRPDRVREVNGRREKFLFATPYISKALAFAFSYRDEEIICNGGLEDSADEYAIVCDSARTLERMRYARVYAFSAQGFEKAEQCEAFIGTGDSRQFVSTAAVPFSQASLVLEIHNIDDLMRHGLQIFSSPKTEKQLSGEGFMDLDIFSGSDKEWLRQKWRQTPLAWENLLRNINPNPSLRQFFGLTPDRKHPGLAL